MIGCLDVASVVLLQGCLISWIFSPSAGAPSTAHTDGGALLACSYLGALVCLLATIMPTCIRVVAHEEHAGGPARVLGGRERVVQRAGAVVAEAPVGDEQQALRVVRPCARRSPSPQAELCTHRPGTVYGSGLVKQKPKTGMLWMLNTGA